VPTIGDELRTIGAQAHNIKTAAPVAIADETAEGDSSALARADHRHKHGELAGGSAHAVANRKEDGFLSSPDYLKLACLGARSYLSHDFITTPETGYPVQDQPAFELDDGAYLYTLQFSDEVRQGALLLLSIPAAATRISLQMTGRALQKQEAGVRAAMHLHHRAIPNNEDLQRWSGAHVIGDIVKIPAATERYQVKKVVLLLEALRLSPGRIYQVQLVRDPGDDLDTLRGVYSLVELAIAFS